MATIDNVNTPPVPGAAPSSTPSAAFKNTLKPDDFIKLFIKQLMTQDPTKPADSSTMLQQLADISMIDASNASQKAIEELKQSLTTTMGTSQWLSSSQMIGKKVEIDSKTAPLFDNDKLYGSVGVPAPASEIKVVIKDSKGNIVNEIAMGKSNGGVLPFQWDGVKPDGTKAEPGMYSMTASATMNGKQMPLETAGAFKVNSVALNQKTGEVLVNLDGVSDNVLLSNIIKIL